MLRKSNKPKGTRSQCFRYCCSDLWGSGPARAAYFSTHSWFSQSLRYFSALLFSSTPNLSSLGQGKQLRRIPWLNFCFPRSHYSRKQCLCWNHWPSWHLAWLRKGQKRTNTQHWIQMLLWVSPLSLVLSRQQTTQHFIHHTVFCCSQTCPGIISDHK